MVAAFDVVRDNLRVSAQRNKRYYDLKVKPAKFKQGDNVYYYNPRKYVGKSDKWCRKYTGPFRIVKELSPVTMLLRAPNNRKSFISHVDKLKLCSQETRPLSPEVQTSNDSTLVADLRPRRNVMPPRRLISEC